MKTSVWINHKNGKLHLCSMSWESYLKFVCFYQDLIIKKAFHNAEPKMERKTGNKFEYLGEL